MTIGKKKRIPKPAKSEYLSQLIALIPFIEANNNSDLVIYAYEWLEQMKFRESRIVKNKDLSLESAIIGDSDSMKALWEIQSNLKRAVNVALVQENINGNSWEASTWLEESLKLGYRRVDWHSKKHTGYQWMLKDEIIKKDKTSFHPQTIVMPKELRFLSASVMIEALYNVIGRESMVKAYVGICPKCGKFFEKNRKDQIWCSGLCGGIARKSISQKKK
ncbi:MAG: hypothetical protein HQM08_27285 [Candidatus Riflebacteria bacterium]|nr:hypothetical protein [Candidatus Riflebacteria bacterium]